MKKAFTLAEVLITLAIIGVVAAMTIPTLISKYQEKQIVTALKKAYSMLSQAYTVVVAENGVPLSWDLTGDDSTTSAEKLTDIFKQYLKIQKDCRSTGKGCFPDVAYKTPDGTGFVNLNNTNITSHLSKVMLNDGMSMYFQVPKNADCKNTICGTIAVDVNGFSGPI